MPDSRPMPDIGRRCHELRITDRVAGASWRIICRIDPDAIIIADTFAKKSRTTPRGAIARAARRLKRYDKATQ